MVGFTNSSCRDQVVICDPFVFSGFNFQPQYLSSVYRLCQSFYYLEYALGIEHEPLELRLSFAKRGGAFMRRAYCPDSVSLIGYLVAHCGKQEGETLKSSLKLKRPKPSSQVGI
jgi:hypothetical protein